MTEVQTAATLSTAESSQLVACETVIQKGLHVFNEVGNALMRVRENRLYRSRFKTFEDYCETRWNLSKARANQLVAAAAVAELISTTTVAEINNEAQARELAPLLDDPDELREVFAEAIERTEGKLTAAAIRAVRTERDRQAETPASTKPEPESTPIRRSSDEVVDLVAKVADSHLGPDLVAARLDTQKRFRVALDAVRRITGFGVDAMAEALDDDDLRTLEMEAGALIDFYNDVVSARRGPANVLFMKPKVVAS